MTTARHPSGAGVLSGRVVFLMFLAFFGVIIAANGVLTWAAVRSWSGAETNSAYRAGQLFNAEREQARMQDARGWTLAAVMLRGAEGAAHVTVEARDRADNALRGRELRATLQRPADQRRDRHIALTESAPGRYEAELADVAPGQWDLIVEVWEDDARAFRRRSRIVLP